MLLRAVVNSNLVQVLTVYLTSLIISIVNFKEVLSITALSISIIFTSYKFIKEIINNKNKKI